MKLLVLLIFSFCFSVQTHAGFVQTTHDFGNYVPKGESLSATFQYKNSTNSPAIIIIPSESGLFAGCKVTSYTKAPILKNYIGRVNISCNFSDVGFNLKQIATALIHQNNTTSPYQLSARAMVVEASECKPMDLNPNTVLKNMPMLDQDGMGICYAFTSSQMIEYEAKKNGINRSFSSIDASFVTKAKDIAETFQLDSGQPDKAIKAIIKDGVASRGCIDNVIKKHTQGTSLSSEEFLALVEDVWIARRAKTTEAKIKADLQSTCDQYGISVNQFSDLLKDLNKPFKTFIYDMFKECNLDRQKAKVIQDLDLDLKTKVSGSNSEMVKFMDKFLDKQKIPNLTICAEIIQGKPEHRGLLLSDKREFKKNKEGKRDCGSHSVLVTARRKVGHSCEYLIRNSWGGSWAPKDMKCACKTAQGYYPDCSLNKEKSGNKVMVGCWVKEENLIPNTKNILGFE
jgi:hypothetical protein